ncbi:hypothetical protein ACFVR2_19100 [Gottfriedia sp. NPDC057991]|uniref:hypothetical protein n=1 Tax=Gottfriedia sp. NPDC057991 TaxID=3346298 RepID=UPI0036DF50DE
MKKLFKHATISVITVAILDSIIPMKSHAEEITKPTSQNTINQINTQTSLPAPSIIQVRAVTIGLAVGGGAVQAYIIKKGKPSAAKLFTKTITSKLNAWGAKKLATTVGLVVITALNYADIGTNIAKLIDKYDTKPNNGYIDFE